MGDWSVQLSMRSRNSGETKWNTEQYPINRLGQQGTTVSGIDPEVAGAIRGNRKGDTFVLDERQAAKLAAAIADGGRVTAYEKPVYNAAIFALKGKDVQITDDTGHWRDISFTEAGAKAFFDGVRGVNIDA